MFLHFNLFLFLLPFHFSFPRFTRLFFLRFRLVVSFRLVYQQKVETGNRVRYCARVLLAFQVRVMRYRISSYII